MFIKKVTIYELRSSDILLTIEMPYFKETYAYFVFKSGTIWYFIAYVQPFWFLHGGIYIS